MTSLLQLHKYVSPEAYDLALYLAAHGSILYSKHTDKVRDSVTGRKTHGEYVRELINIGVACLKPGGLLVPTERLAVQILFEPTDK